MAAADTQATAAALALAGTNLVRVSVEREGSIGSTSIITSSSVGAACSTTKEGLL